MRADRRVREDMLGLGSRLWCWIELLGRQSRDERRFEGRQRGWREIDMIRGHVYHRCRVTRSLAPLLLIGHCRCYS